MGESKGVRDEFTIHVRGLKLGASGTLDEKEKQPMFLMRSIKKTSI